jgi:hypothetical protein
MTRVWIVTGVDFSLGVAQTSYRTRYLLDTVGVFSSGGRARS